MREKNSLSGRVLMPVLAMVLVAASSGLLHAARTCNPREFGAKADGTTKDTAAIQQAIDSCAAKGGGTVSIWVELNGLMRAKA